MTKNSSDRLLELDVLRGLAAISVMLFHYTTHYTEITHHAKAILFQFPLGRYGVQLFFVISGFVILMTLEKTGRPLDFIISRFSRLYPCYWAAIILTFTVVRIFHYDTTSLMQAFINMSMLQGFLGIKNVDGVYWTLTVELSFYLIMFLLFVAKKLKHIELFGLAWLILMVWNRKLSYLLHFHMPPWVDAAGLLTFGHLFIAGIFFYNLKTKGHAWHRHAGLALCLLTLYVLRTDDIIEPTVGVVMFLIFYLFVLGKMAWIVNKPMVYLGAISYSGYLIHQNIGNIMVEYLYTIHANAYLTIIVPALCSLLIATVITYAVEKPSIAYIRQKYKIWKQRNSFKNYMFK